MRRTGMMLGLVLILLAGLDGVVALGLGWAESSGRLGSLVRYFDYGRSVPGKLARWEAAPDRPGNLYDVAWRDAALARSAQEFAAETAAGGAGGGSGSGSGDGPGDGPVIRSYGMSFVDNIIAQALALRPDLSWDGMAGPAAPPNFTYALFEDDRANRRAGDVVVLGILSSAVPAMAALSNRTWAFEQPAPFTYPIYRPEGAAGLRRVDPLVVSAAAQRALSGDAAARAQWQAQLRREDLFHGPRAFAWPWLDVSPFARLLRRSLATAHVARVNRRILREGAYPHAETLRRMIAEFAATARADGQIPLVMLVQTRDPRDADLLAIAGPLLAREGIAYLATAELFDPSDPMGFLADGHYTPAVDRIFARAFLNRLGI